MKSELDLDDLRRSPEPDLVKVRAVLQSAVLDHPVLSKYDSIDHLMGLVGLMIEHEFLLTWLKKNLTPVRASFVFLRTLAKQELGRDILSSEFALLVKVFGLKMIKGHVQTIRFVGNVDVEEDGVAGAYEYVAMNSFQDESNLALHISDLTVHSKASMNMIESAIKKLTERQQVLEMARALSHLTRRGLSIGDAKDVLREEAKKKGLPPLKDRTLNAVRDLAVEKGLYQPKRKPMVLRKVLIDEATVADLKAVMAPNGGTFNLEVAVNQALRRFVEMLAI